MRPAQGPAMAISLNPQEFPDEHIYIQREREISFSHPYPHSALPAHIVPVCLSDVCQCANI